MKIKNIKYVLTGISMFAAAYAFAEEQGKTITIDQAYTSTVYGTSDGEIINGDLHMNMTGGNITVGNTNVIRGVVNNATVNGNVYIDISGGDIIHTSSPYSSFGINPGDLTQWAQTETGRGIITGNTFVNIDMNNTSATNVYGGGNIGGNTNVSIKNGKFAFIVGGGIGTDVAGLSTVTMSGGTVNGNVYAGGSFDSISTIVKGNTNVELSGGSANFTGTSGETKQSIVFSGVYVPGNSPAITTFTNVNVDFKSVTDGSSTSLLKMEVFGTDSVAGKDFDQVAVSNSTMNFGTNGEMQIFVDTQNGAQFQEGTFTYNLFDLKDSGTITGLGEGEVTIVLSDTIKNSWDVNFVDGSKELTNSDALTELMTNGNVSLVFTQVPEPSTHAAILGILTLALAIYRRKK